MGERYDFRMCRYCGQRLGEMAFSRYGKPRPDGWYCSRDCAMAVHGFDMQIDKERSARRIVSLDPTKHDRICPNTPPPWEALARKEEGGVDAEEHERMHRALEAMGKAAAFDTRLPGILQRLADGDTVEEVGKRMGMTRPAVGMLLSRFRATL